MQDRKFLVEYEALRGIAAVVVLIHHFMLGFTPRLHGLLYPDQPLSLMGTPAFALINGSAAVVIFFVLSGFVLTVRLFDRPNFRMALVAAAKRWPRLAGTVIAANLIAGAFMGFGLFKNVHVATLVPSIWLGWFYKWDGAGVAIEIASSIWDGATTFFTGTAQYNSNLWTMYYEFWGSMIALGSAAICSAIRPVRMQSAVLAVLGAVVFSFDAYLSSFLVGVWLGKNHVARPNVTWTGWPVYALIVIAILLLGYHEDSAGRAEGIYRVLAPLTALDALRLRVVLHSIAAAIVMLLFVRVGPIRSLISGPVGRILGFMSFAIYLAQIIIICSFSAMTYAALLDAPHIVRILLTFLVTVVGTVLLAIPLAFFDRWWVRTLNRFAFDRFRDGIGRSRNPLPAVHLTRWTRRRL